MNPDLMDSAPSEGPTTCSCTMVAGAGSFPDFSTLVRSVASSMLKFPVIEDEPPVISPCTLGYEYTVPSSTMAIWRPMLSLVRRAHTLAPSAFMVMDTLGSPPWLLLYSTLASVTTLPSRGAFPSREAALMATSS